MVLLISIAQKGRTPGSIAGGGFWTPGAIGLPMDVGKRARGAANMSSAGPYGESFDLFDHDLNGTGVAWQLVPDPVPYFIENQGHVSFVQLVVLDDQGLVDRPL